MAEEYAECLLENKFHENCPGCKVDQMKRLRRGFPFSELLTVWLIVLCTALPISSLFPFLYFMIGDFNIAKKEEDIGFYAGFVGMRSKAIAIEDKTSYDDFVHMVIKEYKVNEQIYEVELSYMFPKKVLLTLPQNTPPIDIKNQRQFTGFLEQLKMEAMQVCLELKERVLEKDEDKSDDEDEGSIFDYCDDLDGASSGDEDFALNGIHAEEEEKEKEEEEEEDKEEEEEEEEKKNKISTSMKSGSTSGSVPVKRGNVHVKLELDALNIAVGQRYDTKDALETRLKILSVLRQFDFRVDRSATDILTIKCWIEGCTWRVRATPVGNSTQFTIRTHVSEHSCSITERSASARQATPEILARLYVDYVGGVDSKVLPKHVGEALNMRFGVKMDYWKARDNNNDWKARDNND